MRFFLWKGVRVHPAAAWKPACMLLEATIGVHLWFPPPLDACQGSVRPAWVDKCLPCFVCSWLGWQGLSLSTAPELCWAVG